MTRCVGTDYPNTRLGDSSKKLLLQHLSFFIHFGKTAGGKHNSSDTSGGTFSNRLDIQLGRKDDDGEVNPIRKFLDRAIGFHPHDFIAIGVNQIKLP